MPPGRALSYGINSRFIIALPPQSPSLRGNRGYRCHQSVTYNLPVCSGFAQTTTRNHSVKAWSKPILALMTTQTQVRTHFGHSHGHHHHDNSYLVSSNKSDAGVRITRIGLYVNLGMAIGKGVGGYVFNSKALTADAVHSLTDLVSDFMTLATISWALKPPNPKFPRGYGKIESLGSLGVSGILLVGGFLMGWSAVMTLLQQLAPDFVHTVEQLGLIHEHAHSHSHTDLGPNINAAWLAGGSIIIKEWLYRKTLQVAKEKKSSVLASNAYHHRVDSLTAFVALLTIAGSNFLSNASWLDPIGGLVISLMVVQAGWSNTRSALLELADAGIDDDTKNRVSRAVLRALDEQVSDYGTEIKLRKVQGMKGGQNYLMDVELGVPGSWTIEKSKHIEEYIRAEVGAKVRGVKRVRVRFVPNGAERPDLMDEFITDSPKENPESHNGHEHEHEHEHSHRS